MTSRCHWPMREADRGPRPRSRATGMHSEAERSSAARLGSLSLSLSLSHMLAVLWQLFFRSILCSGHFVLGSACHIYSC